MFKRRLLTTLISVALLSTGCASFKEYQAPTQAETLKEAKLDPVDNARIVVDAQPVIAWWGEFNDPVLSDLVAQAMKNNLDIRVAYANLLQARALSREAGYGRQPTVNATGSATRNLNSQETPNGQNMPRTNNSFEAGFDASWELNLFGRVSARIAAQESLAEASEADWQQMQVTIAAEVAKTYAELRGAQYRLDIANRNLDNQAESLKLTQVLLDAGAATALDVARAETQLTVTKASIPVLNATVTAAINRLSVLTGKVPDATQSKLNAAAPLPSLPLTIALGDAGALLKRRPDVRAAERNLASTVAQYNLAEADLFPTVRLMGSLGFIATNLSSFGTSALAASLGPSLDWQVFNRGAIRARIAQADAQSQAQLATYEKTVLSALEETQTAVSNFAQQENKRAQLQKAARSAQTAATLAKQRFDQGYDDFLDVLVAEKTLLETEDTLAVSEIESVTNLIAIYKALGGGWQINTE